MRKKYEKKERVKKMERKNVIFKTFSQSDSYKAFFSIDQDDNIFIHRAKKKESKGESVRTRMIKGTWNVKRNRKKDIEKDCDIYKKNNERDQKTENERMKVET